MRSLHLDFTRRNFGSDKLEPEFGPVSKSWDLWLPLAILFMGVVLLQHHSIRFWQSWVGDWAGIAWSILLELISLWFWFVAAKPYLSGRAHLGRTRIQLLAILATGLLLLGPLYMISQPVLKDWRQHLSETYEVESLREQIADRRTVLATYLQNSRTRLGWQRKIDQAEARLQKSIIRLDAIISSTGGHFQWEKWIAIGMQAAALIVFQVANIHAIRTISRASCADPRFQIPSPTPGNVATPRFPDRWEMETRGNTDRVVDQRVASLQRAIKSHLDSDKLSQAEFCRRHGLNPRDVSLLFNYFRLKAKGKRKVPKTLIDRLAQRFLPGVGKGA